MAIAAAAVALALAATYILYTYMVNRSSRLVRLLERGGELSSNLIEWAKLLTEILLGSGFFGFCRSENLDWLGQKWCSHCPGHQGYGLKNKLVHAPLRRQRTRRQSVSTKTRDSRWGRKIPSSRGTLWKSWPPRPTVSIYYLWLFESSGKSCVSGFSHPWFFFFFQSLRKRSNNGTKDFSKTVPTVCSPSRASSRSTPNSSPTETRQSSPRLYFVCLTKIRMAQLNSRSLFERSPSRLEATLTKNSIVSWIVAGNGRDESKKKNDAMTVHKLCLLGREVAPRMIY